MTRKTNNSLRKLAMRGLVLAGFVLGGLGSVGCDDQTLVPNGSQLSAVASAVRPEMGVSLDKGSDADKIWHPRSKMWYPRR